MTTYYNVGDRVEFTVDYAGGDAKRGDKGTVEYGNRYGDLLSIRMDDTGRTISAYAWRVKSIPAAPAEPVPTFAIGETVTLTEARGYSYPVGTVGVVTAHRLSYSRPGVFIDTVQTLDGGEFSSFEFRLAPYEFKVDDVAVVTSPIYCADTAGGAFENDLTIGERVVVKRGTPDIDGDIYVRRESSTSAYGGIYQTPAGLSLVEHAHTAKPSDFPVGTKVVVSADAKMHDGSGVFFGGEVVATVIESPADYYANDVRVQDDTLTMQYVAPKWLTKYEPKASDFPVGTKVLVAADAKTHDGGSVFFGDVETVGTVIGESWSGKNVDVRRDSDGKSQFVGPQYLSEYVAPEPEPEPKPLPEVGDKFIVTDEAGNHGFPVGTLVRVVRTFGGAEVLATTLAEDSTSWKRGVTAYVQTDADGYMSANVRPATKVDELLAQIDALRAQVAALAETE